jgi:hypothetical protein
MRQRIQDRDRTIRTTYLLQPQRQGVQDGQKVTKVETLFDNLPTTGEGDYRGWGKDPKRNATQVAWRTSTSRYKGEL